MQKTALDNTEQLIRLILRFLDLSRDLERNRDDFEFSQTGGKITYVYDASIFEVFINPKDRRGQGVSLHAPGWVKAEAGSTVPAQSALLTAEYILSGELPGQTAPRIFMTEWHRWELGRRMRYLHTKYRDKLRLLSEDETGRRFSKIAEALERVSQEESMDVFQSVDPQLGKDFSNVAESISESIGEESLLEAKRTFIATRLAVEALAEDNRFEPSEQLLRIVDKEFRDRFTTLHLTYRPTRDNLSIIAASQAEWRKRLVNECELQGIPRHSSRPDDPAAGTVGRSTAALIDDAKSLAFVEWAAVQASDVNERIVFVTADNLLFDAYRRWYSNLEIGDPAYQQPFLMRRLVQYAPMFNLGDQRNMLRGNVFRFFRQLENALELTLLPLNLSRLSRGSGQEIVTRMRELMALRLIDNTSIVDDPIYRALVNALDRREFPRTEFFDILDQWKRLERTALGLVDDYMRARLLKREQSLREWGLIGYSRIEGTGKAFGGYVEWLISRLQKGARDLWLPLSREFIEAWKPVPGRIARAPTAFGLELSVGKERLSISHRIEARLDGQHLPIVSEDAWPLLERSPEYVFAIAACLALASDDWYNADHFAEMALSEVQAGWTSEAVGAFPRPERQLYELEFLSALTKRFHFGLYAPATNPSSYRRIEQSYRDSQKLLAACVDFHDGKSDVQHQLRLLRALSERAALHLFFASSIAPPVAKSARDSSALRSSREEPSSEFQVKANCALQCAEDDLHRFARLSSSLAAHLNDNGEAIFDKLKQQASTNLAAACVLRQILSERGESVSALATEYARLRIRGVSVEALTRLSLQQWTGESMIPLKAEIYAFLSLLGDAKDRWQFGEFLNRYAGRQLRGQLRLDVAIVDTINQHSHLFVPENVAEVLP